MDESLGKALLRIARRAIAHALGAVASDLEIEEDPRLGLSGAVFVTLTQYGELRGCIGSLQAHRPLGDDCRRNALAAAFEDPRFPAVTREELESIRIEVSLLSKPQVFPCRDEDDACQRLRPGIDGVILSWQGRRATFLPQVWEQISAPHEFLAALRRKAGLPANFWAKDLQLEIYQVEHVQES